MNDIPNLTQRDIAELLHELRTPLGGLRAMCEMVEQKATPEALAALRSSIDHLETIADRVLMREPQALPKLTLNALLGLLAPGITQRAGVKGITVAMAVTPTAGSLEVEATPFRQVIENLLENTLRVQTGGKLEIAAYCRADGRLAVSVRDEGPGLTNDDARRLIAEGGAISGRKGGAGLGLSICGKLVAAQGGMLAGGTRDDGRPGAEFRFDWPGLVRPEEADAPVLIVDDHPASRQVLRVILAHLGLRAMEAEGVEPALELISRHAFALVMTDLTMEAGGGKRLIERLKVDAPATKIAVVSGDQPDMAVDAFVMKPISVKAIALMLENTGVLDKIRAA